MYLALREMRKQKVKYLVIIGVLISLIYLVLFTVGLSQGLEYFGTSKIINSSAETFILAEGTGGRMEQSEFGPNRATDLIEEIGVDGTFLGVQPSTIYNDSDQADDQTFGIVYMYMPGNSFMQPNLVEGRMPENDREVLASAYILQEGVELGDTIVDDNFNATYEIVGITEDETYNYSAIIYQNADQYAGVTVQGAFLGFSNVSAVVLEEGEEVIPDHIHDYQVDIVNRDEIINTTPGLRQQSASFTILVISMYIITATIVAMFFYIVTSQKRSEYGLLKAVGAKTGTLYKVILSQIAIVMGTAIIFGALLITVTAAALPPVVPFRFDWRYILVVSLIFGLVAVVGAIVSVRYVSKIDPVIAMASKH